MLCDEQAEFGGSLLGDTAARIDGATRYRLGGEIAGVVAAERSRHLLARTTAFGYFPHNLLG